MPALAYFITFSTYGARVHGDEKGSVDRTHNEVGRPFLPPDDALAAHRRGLMHQPPYTLALQRGFLAGE